MNKKIFFAFNSLTKKSKIFDFFVIFFAKYVIFIAILGYLVALFSEATKDFFNINERNLFVIGVVGILSWTIALFIKFVHFTPRPYLTKETKALIKKRKASSAFPSGHTALFFAVGSISLLYSFWLGVILLLGGILIGLARLTAGLHWPVDIFGGAVLGLLISLVMWLIL